MKPNILIAEDDSIIPDKTMELFEYFVGYDKLNISWTKIKKFDTEYELGLSTEQKLFLHNLQFKTN